MSSASNQPKHLGAILSRGMSDGGHRAALYQGEVEFTFSSLMNIADNIAIHLTRLGVSRGDVCFVSSTKKWQLVPLAIGIWKCGATYLPVDRELPAQRQRFIANETEPKVLFGLAADRELLEGLRPGARVVSYEDEKIFSETKGYFVPDRRISAEDTAYIMYTSGSTGTPKGVTMSHAAVTSYFVGHNEILLFDDSSRCLNNAPFHFDVSIQDVFLPLYFGASVFLTDGLPIASKLLSIVENYRITHVIAVASILTIMTPSVEALNRRNLESVRVVMTGAEVCSSAVINAWIEALPTVRVINGYGPTEVNSISLTHTITRENLSNHHYPIGKPLKTVQAALIDEEGNLIRYPNLRGELVLTGPQLMKGYWRRDELTEAAMITVNGIRYYKTGDIAYLDSHGDYHYVGREDTEVKVNGRRINMAEIQEALLKVDGVSHAAVDLLTLNNVKVFAAAIVLKEGTAPYKYRTLVDYLSTLLPRYMVPTLYAQLRESFLSSNGKFLKVPIMEKLRGHSEAYNGNNFYFSHKGENAEVME